MIEKVRERWEGRQREAMQRGAATATSAGGWGRRGWRLRRHGGVGGEEDTIAQRKRRSCGGRRKEVAGSRGEEQRGHALPLSRDRGTLFIYCIC
jgi:hypothetical protein